MQERAQAGNARRRRGAVPTDQRRRKEKAWIELQIEDADTSFEELGAEVQGRWQVDYHGLGPYPMISLAEARERAAKAQRMLFDGLDPIEAKRAAKIAAAKAMTFAKAAEDYIAGHGATWSRKHLVQWRQTLARLVLPVIGEMDVAAVDTGDVLRVLTPIWTKTPVTASRVARRVRVGPRQRDGAGLERRGSKPGNMAPPSRQAPAGADEDCARRAFRRNGLPRHRRLHGGVALARRRRSARAGVHDPDRRSQRGGIGRAMERDRPGRQVWTIPLAGNIEFRCPTRRSRSSSRWR